VTPQRSPPAPSWWSIPCLSQIPHGHHPWGSRATRVGIEVMRETVCSGHASRSSGISSFRCDASMPPLLAGEDFVVDPLWRFERNQDQINILPCHHSARPPAVIVTGSPRATPGDPSVV
jgi:hypothetical protein